MLVPVYIYYMMTHMNSGAEQDPRTHALLVHTQCYENYAFDEQGRMDTENPYWKPKGGSEYLVVGVDPESTDVELTMVLDKVRPRIEIDNPAYQEYILGWKVVPADFSFGDEYEDKWLVRIDAR